MDEILMREYLRSKGKGMSDEDFMRNMKEHFNDSYAKYTVSKMFHTEGDRKYVGEKFDMLKAKEICERYRGIIPQSATHGDVYVAINAQYLRHGLGIV